jgi:SAM-dependent methyltransferase
MLNTIKEESEHGSNSESEGSGSDGTIVGRPAGWNPKMFVAAPRKSSRLSTSFTASSPVSSVDASPLDEDDGFGRRARRSYAQSDNGTVFSEESCPSLASDPTSFATDSSRNSMASSTKSGRNRYPALLIPRGSWNLDNSPIKEVALGMSPVAKVILSPEVLSAFARRPPVDNAPPSLGTSSVASHSPCVGALSLPGTPDSRQLEIAEGEPWGQPPELSDNHLEIAVDDETSVVLSPQDAHGSRLTLLVPPPDRHRGLPSAREREWGDMVTRFPAVPGLTPMSNDNPFPVIKGQRRDSKRMSTTGTDSGVLLPNDALQTLQRITQEISPDELSDNAPSARDLEMRERVEGELRRRHRSLDAMTPATEASISKLSEYSFTSLSIPSPGGFFSSLQAGSRQTWCMNKSVENSVPTSAVAEQFYANWEPRGDIRQTTVSVDDGNETDGPPTARQAAFQLDPTTATKDGFDESAANRERRASVSTSDEDDDMYGPGPNEPNFTAPAEIEYEEAYEEELRQTSEQNKDRTSNWLAAQTSYMAALRETNPVNNPEDYAPSPHPFNEEPEMRPRSASVDSHIRKTVRFLEAAKAISPVVDSSRSGSSSSSSESSNKEVLFRAAFEHLVRNKRSGDVFMAAGARLDAVRAGRVATPAKHVDSLLGRMQIDIASRPKYSGPFNQNPRATGIFERSKESLAYEAAEREQRALAIVATSAWQTEALRVANNGRLFASRLAHQRLKAKAKVPLTDAACVGSRRVRILDLGGDANASWGWSAAYEYTNVKVYTVITKEQAASQRPAGLPKPEGPDNHRTVSVPYLWQLPFKTNHFDVVSARSLHALLKANPVPGAPGIDEWTMTLKECMRILKPGGFIDFVVMDSSVARPGPRGEALSVEFGFDLHRRGYDRDPARSWLRRLHKEGFIKTKRAWMFWPVGRKPDATEGEQGARAFVPAPRPVSEVSTISKIVKQYLDVEAVQGPVGSTQDAADITGLLGTRMYEEWVVKIRQETGRESSRLLEGIDEVLEEGKMNGGGFRVLVGWAQKPGPVKKQKSEVKAKIVSDSPIKEEIMIALDSDTEVEMPRAGARISDVGEIPVMISG